MPSIVDELSAAAVKALRHGQVTGKARGSATSSKAIGEPCTKFHTVGGVRGLILICKPPVGDAEIGARSWILRIQVGKKRREIGLGPYPEVSLKEAKDEARELRRKVRRGIDPVAEKRATKAALIEQQERQVPFKHYAGLYLKKKEGTKNAKDEPITMKTINRIKSELDVYILPHLGDMAIIDVKRADVIRTLKHDDLWDSKRYTANRARMHIHDIIQEAIAEEIYPRANPAVWKKNLEHSLPNVSKATGLPALKIDNIEVFYKELIAHDSVSSLVLQFQILTACRPGMARQAEWSEIDLVNKLWEIPASKMKTGEPFRQPLSKPALALLESLDRASDYIFPNPKGKPISDSMISRLPKTLGYASISSHGFRKTFSNFHANYGRGYSKETKEVALAHAKEGVFGTYETDDRLPERRLLIEEWGDFVLKGAQGRVKGEAPKLRVVA